MANQLAAKCAALFCVALLSATPLFAQEPRCRFLCAPTLLVEPTLTIEDLAETRGSVFETIVAVDIPTKLSRLGFTLEAIMTPFARAEDDLRDNAVELESEVNLTWLEPRQTGGWISSHFDVVDKFSPAERPGDRSVYTHKLNFELDTAVALFQRLSKDIWLRDVELETSLDYVATGLPRGASPWSLSLVVVIPIIKGQ